MGFVWFDVWVVVVPSFLEVGPSETEFAIGFLKKLEPRVSVVSHKEYFNKLNIFICLCFRKKSFTTDFIESCNLI